MQLWRARRICAAPWAAGGASWTMNLWHREANKIRSSRRLARAAVQFLEKRSNQMRKKMIFTFGVLVGTVVATAWANFPSHRLTSAPAVAAASMNPFEMMMSVRPLPVQHHDF
jgi:hypothetical protein